MRRRQGISFALAIVAAGGALAMETGMIPPTINLNKVDPECAGIDFVANTAKKADVRYAMSNAFGFGGQNSSILLKKHM